MLTVGLESVGAAVTTIVSIGATVGLAVGLPVVGFNQEYVGLVSLVDVGELSKTAALGASVGTIITVWVGMLTTEVGETTEVGVVTDVGVVTATDVGVVTVVGVVTLTEVGEVTLTEVGVVTLTEVGVVTLTEVGVVTLTEVGVVTLTEVGVVTLTVVGTVSVTEVGVVTLTEVGTVTVTEVGLVTLTEVGVVTLTEVGFVTLTEVGVVTLTEVGVKTDTEVGVETLTEVGVVTLTVVGDVTNVAVGVVTETVTEEVGVVTIPGTESDPRESLSSVSDLLFFNLLPELCAPREFFTTLVVDSKLLELVSSDFSRNERALGTVPVGKILLANETSAIRMTAKTRMPTRYLEVIIDCRLTTTSESENTFCSMTSGFSSSN